MKDKLIAIPTPISTIPKPIRVADIISTIAFVNISTKRTRRTLGRAPFTESFIGALLPCHHTLHRSFFPLAEMVYRLTKRPLFGGAIDIDVPSAWRDVSEVRQVPDHQEVWQDCTVEGQAPSELAAAAAQGAQAGEPISIEGTGGVLVVEILARQDDVSDEAAAKFFFDDLAESNGAIADDERRMDFAQVSCVGGDSGSASGSGDTNTVSLMTRLDKAATLCTCIGVQRVELGKDRKVGGESEPRSDHWAVRIEMCVLRLVEQETDLLISLTRPIQDGSDKTMEDIMEASTHSKLFLDIIETFAIQNWELFG